MSLTLDGTASARIASSERGVAWLVEMDFTSGILRWTTAPVSLTIGGNVYTGLGALAEISQVSESEATTAERLTMSFSLVSTAMLAASIGSIDTYRGRAARLYLQLFDTAFQPAGAPVLRWSGTMDRVQVTRKPAPPEGGSGGGRVEMQCSRSGMARARNYQGLRLTNAQQQQRFPGDRGLEYVQTLIETPSLWLSKAFQKV